MTTVPFAATNTDKEMREREPSDFYPTPAALVECVYNQLAETYFEYADRYERFTLLDPGAGDGIWGHIARERFLRVEMTGIEVRDVAEPVADFNHRLYDHWHHKSFVPTKAPKPVRPLETYKSYKKYQEAVAKYDMQLMIHQAPLWQPTEDERQFDLIIGNPPYGVAEKFIRRGLELQSDNGLMIFLLRLNFLGGQQRGKSLFRKYPPRHLWVCSRRPSYTGDGKTDATEYCIFVWEKGYEGHPELDWLAY